MDDDTGLHFNDFEVRIKDTCDAFFLMCESIYATVDIFSIWSSADGNENLIMIKERIHKIFDSLDDVDSLLLTIKEEIQVVDKKRRLRATHCDSKVFDSISNLRKLLFNIETHIGDCCKKLNEIKEACKSFISGQLLLEAERNKT